MVLTLDLMPMEEKPAEALPAKTIVVRYGFLKSIGEFPSDLTTKVGCGSKLVIRTDRGTEIGEMLTTTCANGSCSKSISREQLLSYIDKSGRREYPFSEQGRVLRVATAQDMAEQAKLDEQRKPDIAMARQLVERHMLALKIVDIEYLLGHERVLIYFNSEQRIDFRNMVRDLAHELHARIELRQVGARDEARISADYEKCGQHCCCKKFLKVLTPISMRSAKIQKATLDPAKISGRCGRLMCCLRYEDQTYEELRKKLPRRNTRVKTAAGECWVLDGQILTQLVLVQADDGTRTAIPIEQIEAFDLPKPKLPNGQTMQTPNDRMPEGAMPLAPAGRGPGGPRNGPPAVRPKPTYSTPKHGEAEAQAPAEVAEPAAGGADGAQAGAVGGPVAPAAPVQRPQIVPPAVAAQRPAPVQNQNRSANQGGNQAPNPNRNRPANTPAVPAARPLPPRPVRGPMLPPKLGPRGTPPLRGKLNPQVQPPAGQGPAGQTPVPAPAAQAAASAPVVAPATSETPPVVPAAPVTPPVADSANPPA